MVRFVCHSDSDVIWYHNRNRVTKRRGNIKVGVLADNKTLHFLEIISVLRTNKGEYRCEGEINNGEKIVYFYDKGKLHVSQKLPHKEESTTLYGEDPKLRPIYISERSYGTVVHISPTISNIFLLHTFL